MKKRVTIYLEEQQHRKARIRVAELGTNFSDYLQGLIAKELASSGKQKKSRRTNDTAGNPPIY